MTSDAPMTKQDFTVEAEAAFSAADDIDLAECAREPIRFLGEIQPHGALIALSPETRQILRVSENVSQLLGFAPSNLLGQVVDDVFGEGAFAALDGQDLSPLMPNVLAPFESAITGPDGQERVFATVAHAHAGEILIELTQDHAIIGEAHYARALNARLATLREGDSETGLGSLLVDLVRAVTGYDRVMAYRFLDDWSGEVIAESIAEGADSYEGLRFPASDIPPQARDLYHSSVLRLVVDVDAPASRILSHDEAPSAPPDLSFAMLRSVSPVHLQYLRNMGVQSTLSVSVVVEDRLWGLIACHHPTPKSPGPGVLAYLRQLSWVAASWVALARERERLRYERAIQMVLRSIQENDAIDMPTPIALAATLQDAARAIGAADCAAFCEDAYVGDQAEARRPSDETINELHDRGVPIILERATDTQRAFPGAAPFAGVVAFALPALKDGPKPWAAFFFPEETGEVRWAGDPSKPVSVGEDGARHLSPRTSFEVWTEAKRGAATPISDDEKAFAWRLKEALGDWILRRAAQSKRRRAALFAAAAEAAPAAIAVGVAERGVARLEHANATFLDMTGYANEVIADLRACDLFEDAAGSASGGALAKAMTSGGAAEGDVHVRLPIGASRPARASVTPIAPAKGGDKPAFMLVLRWL